MNKDNGYRDIQDAYDAAKALGREMAEYIDPEDGGRYTYNDNPFNKESELTLHVYWAEGYNDVKQDQLMIRLGIKQRPLYHQEKVDWIREGF